MASDNKKVLPCAVSNCPGKVGERSITGLCKNCYGMMHGWLNKRTEKQRITRARQLQLAEDRMRYLLPEKNTVFDSKKKFQKLAVLPGQVSQYRKRTKYKVVK